MSKTSDNILNISHEEKVKYLRSCTDKAFDCGHILFEDEGKDTWNIVLSEGGFWSEIPAYMAYPIVKIKMNL